MVAPIQSQLYSILPTSIMPDRLRLPKELILIRHGQSEANVGLSKDPNCHLTPHGWSQARELGATLAAEVATDDLAELIPLTSPYHRTMQTASAISAATGLQFQIDEDVREWGVTATVEDKVHHEEPIEAVIARLEMFLARRASQRLLIVSHATPIAIVTQLMRGEALTTTGRFWDGVENCCLRRIRTG